MFDVLDEYDVALVNNAVAKNIIKMGRKFGMSDTDMINTIASELGCPRPKAEEYFYEFSAAQQPTTSV